jgi:hypothetical protein
MNDVRKVEVDDLKIEYELADFTSHIGPGRARVSARMQAKRRQGSV